MNILVIGSGGREHALCYAIAKSPLLSKLYIIGGNAGINRLAENIDIKQDDFEAIYSICIEKNIELIIVGPEAPLEKGIGNYFKDKNILCFAPTKEAAILESSKGFTKDICKKLNVPTAAYERFYDAKSALQYIETQSLPLVIKADGLAAGKGVVIAETLIDAKQAINDMFSGSFGDAGTSIVIEEFLEGEEASFFVICDGKNCIPLATAQDHKRVGDGDVGLNTGGMGAYSPAPIMTQAREQEAINKIIKPILAEMQNRGTPFIGVLYAGLMMTKNGVQLIEFNTRFGDPECQVLMMRLKSDIVPLFIAAAKGDLNNIILEWSGKIALTVVFAAKGYPQDYKKGTEIKGLEKVQTLNDVYVFHAGTIEKDNKILANGGRVLNVTALGDTVKDAQTKAYQAIEFIDWQDGFYRKDIGWRAV